VGALIAGVVHNAHETATSRTGRAERSLGHDSRAGAIGTPSFVDGVRFFAEALTTKFLEPAPIDSIYVRIEAEADPHIFTAAERSPWQP
jgi:hypothetical protein